MPLWAPRTTSRRWRTGCVVAITCVGTPEAADDATACEERPGLAGHSGAVDATEGAGAVARVDGERRKEADDDWLASIEARAAHPVTPANNASTTSSRCTPTRTPLRLIWFAGAI